MRRLTGIIGRIGITAVCLAFCAISPRADGAADVAVDSAHFPDEGFRDIVSGNCDLDKDGVLSESEIMAVRKLEVGFWTDDTVTEENVNSVRSVEGIEYFTELKELWIGYEDSFEGRFPAAISSVDLSNNKKIEKLTLIADVTKLDLSANKNITQLEVCSHRLKTLDITALRKLVKVSFTDCCQLTDLSMHTVKKVDGTGYRMGHDDSNVPGSFYRCARLSTITFTGNAPKFHADSFGNPILVATIFYPEGNKTWNKVKNKNYGGILTWKSYDVKDGKISKEQDSKVLPKLPTGVRIGNYLTDGYYKVLSDGVSLMFTQPETDEGTSSLYCVIPASVRVGGYDYPVVSIKKDAFKGYDALEEIWIAAPLQKVDKNAFQSLKKKKTVTITISARDKKTYDRIRNVLKKSKLPKNVKIKRG